MDDEQRIHELSDKRKAKVAGDMIGTTALNLEKATKQLSKEIGLDLSKFPPYLTALNAIRAYEQKVKTYVNKK